MLRYPIVIEQGSARSAFGVVIPDLPGCFSAGDSLDEAMTGAHEAAAAWIDTTLDRGGEIPQPSSLEAVRKMRDYAGWVLAMIEIDPGLLDDSVERINITLPRRVLKRLDAKARMHGETRSGYIARMAIG